jgi:CheY-like chemotaxis protein
MTQIANILLVEDLEDDVFLMRQAFKKAEVRSRLEVAHDGLEAQEYLKGMGKYEDRVRFPFPDVVLLDLNMPRMNGFELLEWMRQDECCSRLVVYVLTSSARDEDVDRSYDLRANAYVLKPSRMGELVAFVRTLHEWHMFVELPHRLKAVGQPIDLS